MFSGGVVFTIVKSFAVLNLVPMPNGLRLYYVPVVNGKENRKAKGFLDILIPLDALGGIWSTTRAFLYGLESLDENIILQGAGKNNSDVLIKVYRERPRGPKGDITGNENCWLRLVSGKEEEERRRIKLGSKDLINLDLACLAVLSFSISSGVHNPKLIL